ncbi:23S rRNA (guanosine(2251)-2'-O)-methyltransferase RlmB [Salidesulfovibrio brasiliensis]|uniref:23S rRNA (guanosine(2251)-2'-O)-methyltransferase RlmB n=1 Tax=Salidesulfovibrio brasiliensis TaxID=221711 RepID=UPI0006D12ED5|nr:23S rRNA (guanosine(2251)-2'-O)-methyltransferase RlmB [Salidesulfovibrio brasiliensis]
MRNKDGKRGPSRGGKDYVVGTKPVMELLESSPGRVDHVMFRKGRHDKTLDRIVELCRKNKIAFRGADAKELDRAYSGNHQGVVAQVAALEYVDIEQLMDEAAETELPLLVALDQVQDPGNVGALARTAYAMGAAGLIVCRHHGAYLGTGAVKSSAGAINHLPVAKANNLAQTLKDCAQRGYEIYASGSGQEAEDVFEAKLNTPAVLVLGNEEKGVRPGVQKHCTRTLNIPFRREFDSLNVAQAGAIIMSLFSRRNP